MLKVEDNCCRSIIISRYSVLATNPPFGALTVKKGEL